MKLVDKKKDLKFGIVLGGLTIYVITIFILSVNVHRLQQDATEINQDFTEIKTKQESFETNFSEELFNDHLAIMETQRLQNEIANLKTEMETLLQDEETNTTYNVNEIYDLYEEFEKNVARNDKAKVESADIDEKLNEWGALLINQELESLASSITTTNEELDTTYQEYLDSLPPPVPAGGGQGYSYLTVTTERGTTHGVYLVKLPMSQYRVKTVSAAGGDCKDNCPTKSLAQYAQENGAIAGMNGSYFCPPDYSNCGGKVNSFDYAFYDSNKGKWINKDARSWFDTGMFTMNGNSISFHKKTTDHGGGSVSGAISNYPALLKNGEEVVDTGLLSSYQKDVRGTRGAMGIGGENIYLAHITNATVIDAAYVMKALGVKHALNMDGGGSSALYVNGGYVLGPGRSLPNAILIVQ